MSGTTRSQSSSRVPATWPRGQGACQPSFPSGGSGCSAIWCPFGAKHESPPSVVCVECPLCQCTASDECKRCRQRHPLVDALWGLLSLCSATCSSFLHHCRNKTCGTPSLPLSYLELLVQMQSSGGRTALCKFRSLRY